ncbi:unnamed protein product [Microthlaspi erraticum]|uniref:Uncharacterized protein n=1 Tax=Microthlaspi erraticum TaxID=1685480 RepID=A0A6D2KID2_9BRAS|nr:unnamed protein product [Microthlaspi erraticum]
MSSSLRFSQQSSYPISVRPVVVAPRKRTLQVSISKKDRKIQRLRDEVSDFYDQKLKSLKPVEKKQKATEWIKKNVVDKEKKIGVVEFGDIIGKGKFDLTEFMLVQIGLIEEDKEKKQKEEEEKLKKKKEEEEKLKKQKEEEEKLKKQREEEEKLKKQKEEEEEKARDERETEKVKRFLDEDDAEKKARDERETEKVKRFLDEDDAEKKARDERETEEVKRLIEEDDAKEKAEEEAHNLLCVALVLGALKHWL